MFPLQELIPLRDDTIGFGLIRERSEAVLLPAMVPRPHPEIDPSRDRKVISREGGRHVVLCEMRWYVPQPDLVGRGVPWPMTRFSPRHPNMYDTVD